MWLTRIISPPGLSTRTNSSSVPSGSGTAVMTYCATTASKTSSGKARFFASITREHFDIAEPQRAHALLRLAQHRLGDVDADRLRGARIIGQRDAGADADVEDAAADAVGLRDRSTAGRASNTVPNTRS